jgi:hypothetical protein
VGRLAGCLWLVLGGFAVIFVAGAAGVGLDATSLLPLLFLLPIVLALIVIVAGQSPVVLFVSAISGFAYAALGVWNYVRAAEFERVNPGSAEMSGGVTSLTFTLLALAIGFWSLGAAGLAVRRRRAGR